MYVLALENNYRCESPSGRADIFNHGYPLLLTYYSLVLLRTVNRDQDFRGLTLSDPKTRLVHIPDIRIIVDALLEFCGDRVKPGLNLFV